MDPNTNLQEQEHIEARRNAAGKLHSYDRYRLYDLRVALREWIDSGGFAPAWTKYPLATASWNKWRGAYSTVKSS